MTTDDTTRPALYILAPLKDYVSRSGPAFRYMKSEGVEIIFNGERYSASPPRATSGKGKGA